MSVLGVRIYTIRNPLVSGSLVWEGVLRPPPCVFRVFRCGFSLWLVHSRSNPVFHTCGSMSTNRVNSLDSSASCSRVCATSDMWFWYMASGLFVYVEIRPCPLVLTEYTSCRLNIVACKHFVLPKSPSVEFGCHFSSVWEFSLYFVSQGEKKS